MRKASKQERGKNISDAHEFEAQKRMRARNAFISLVVIGLVGLLIAKLKILPGYILDLILVVAMVVILARFNHFVKSH